MSDAIKRWISTAIFLFGLLGGLCGCLMYVGMMFVAGSNDSPQEIRSLTFAFATPFFACLVALWKRWIAGCWLIFSFGYYVYAAFKQRSYMLEVRHFPNPPSVRQDVTGLLWFLGPLLLLGLFFVLTDLLKWPKLLEKSHAEN